MAAPPDEAILRSLLNHSPDGIIAIDADLRIVLFSRAAETVFGHSPGEVLGKPLDVLLPPQTNDAHRDVQQFTERMRQSGPDSLLPHRVPVG